jgi:hypothetical protein
MGWKMARLHSLLELVDEKAEIAGWIVLLLAVGGRWFDRLDQWPAVSLVGLSLVTMLGAQYFRGVKVGPTGIGVDDE